MLNLQGLVNWKKRQMLSNVIENIAIMQQMQYVRMISFEPFISA